MERIIRNRVLAASNRATPAIDAKVENLILERLRFSFKCEQLLLYDINHKVFSTTEIELKRDNKRRHTLGCSLFTNQVARVI